MLHKLRELEDKLAVLTKEFTAFRESYVEPVHARPASRSAVRCPAGYVVRSQGPGKWAWINEMTNYTSSVDYDSHDRAAIGAWRNHNERRVEARREDIRKLQEQLAASENQRTAAEMRADDYMEKYEGARAELRHALRALANQGQELGSAPARIKQLEEVVDDQRKMLVDRHDKLDISKNQRLHAEQQLEHLRNWCGSVDDLIKPCLRRLEQEAQTPRPAPATVRTNIRAEVREIEGVLAQLRRESGNDVN